MKVLLEIVVAIVLHPIAFVLALLNIAGRRDLNGVQKVIWAVVCFFWGIGPIPEPGSTGRSQQIGMRDETRRRRRRAPERAHPSMRERGAQEPTHVSAVSAPEMQVRSGGFRLDVLVGDGALW